MTRSRGRRAPGLARGFGYDRWAAAYPWLERLAFGGAMQRARVALLDAWASHLAPGARIVSLGEGPGAALSDVLQRRPDVRATVVDGSQAMLRRAADRLASSLPPAVPPVRWIHADLRRWEPDASFDGVVGCYVLDLFSTAEAAALIERLAGRLAGGAPWLHVDFAPPRPGLRGAPQRAIVRGLYAAFGAATDLRVRRLPDVAAAFRAAGFDVAHQRRGAMGLLESAVWRAPAHDPTK